MHCTVHVNQIQVSLSHDNQIMQLPGKYVRLQYFEKLLENGVHAMDVESALKVAVARLGIEELKDKQKKEAIYRVICKWQGRLISHPT